MTTTALRRIAFGVVPAVLAVGALTGCNNGAPSVQAPPATAGSTGSAPTAAPTDDGGSTDVPTQDAPTPSSTPTDEVSTDTDGPTSTPAGDPAQVCTGEDIFGTPATVGSDTKKGKWGDSLTLSRDFGGSVTMTAGTPKAKKPSSDDYFIDDGQVYLLIKMTVKEKSGSNFIGSTFYALRDGNGNYCDSDLSSDIVPEKDRFDSVTLDKTKKSASGTLVFEVPPGQDYSKYTLMYMSPSTDLGGGESPIAWTE